MHLSLKDKYFSFKITLKSCKSKINYRNEDLNNLFDFVFSLTFLRNKVNTFSSETSVYSFKTFKIKFN